MNKLYVFFSSTKNRMIYMITLPIVALLSISSGLIFVIAPLIFLLGLIFLVEGLSRAIRKKPSKYFIWIGLVSILLPGIFIIALSILNQT